MTKKDMTIMTTDECSSHLRSPNPIFNEKQFLQLFFTVSLLLLANLRTNDCF